MRDPVSVEPISWSPVYWRHGTQAHDRAGVLRPHRAGGRPAARVRHRGRRARPVPGAGEAEDRRPVRGSGAARRGGADRARPRGGARRPAAPVLPADPGRAARAGGGGGAARRHRPHRARQAGPAQYGGGRMSDLERRYRRVLRLLPGWYREQWEQDMVAAFLDSWLTGDPERDECVLEFCKPGWAETASVACLAVRLHLGGPGTPRRYAWGQALRRAVLAVLLVHAVLGVNVLVLLAWSPGLAVWLHLLPWSL